MDFERQCGDCNQCCKWLNFVINGHTKQPGRPCFYLAKNCTVHDRRPKSCQDYHCAYIQGLLPEWMKPSISNVLVNVERWGDNKEHLMLRSIECGTKIESQYLSWLIQFARKHNIGLIYQLDGGWNFIGPDDFMKFFEDSINPYDSNNPLLEKNDDT